MPTPVDARLILSDDALDRTLELFLLAEAALWLTADGGLDGEPHRLGRGHYRAAFLLKRRPGLGGRSVGPGARKAGPAEAAAPTSD